MRKVIHRCTRTSESVERYSIVKAGNYVVGNIMMVIEREHIDMVVVSTHGMSGWRAVPFGSIAAKVPRLVQFPVMLLRAPKPAECTATASRAWELPTSRECRNACTPWLGSQMFVVRPRRVPFSLHRSPLPELQKMRSLLSANALQYECGSAG